MRLNGTGWLPSDSYYLFKVIIVIVDYGVHTTSIDKDYNHGISYSSSSSPSATIDALLSLLPQHLSLHRIHPLNLE